MSPQVSRAALHCQTTRTWKQIDHLKLDDSLKMLVIIVTVSLGPQVSRAVLYCQTTITWKQINHLKLHDSLKMLCHLYD